MKKQKNNEAKNWLFKIHEVKTDITTMISKFIEYEKFQTNVLHGIHNI